VSCSYFSLLSSAGLLLFFDDPDITTLAHFFLSSSSFFSRETLIARTLEDISIFDRSKAEVEVDKFLMDNEMVSYVRLLFAQKGYRQK
jgi:hypothetical protein